MKTKAWSGSTEAAVRAPARAERCLTRTLSSMLVIETFSHRSRMVAPTEKLNHAHFYDFRYSTQTRSPLRYVVSVSHPDLQIPLLFHADLLGRGTVLCDVALEGIRGQ